MNCTKLRRMRIRHFELNITTGKSEDAEATWETRPCGVPLFSDEERKLSLCKSCQSGWTHPENYPVEKA